MLKHFRRLCLRFSLAFVSVISSLNPSGSALASTSTLQVAGGPSSVKDIVEKVKAQFEKDSGTQLQIVGEGGLPSPSVVIAVDSGRAEVGILHAPSWDGMIEYIEKKSGLRLKSKRHLKNLEIGTEGTYFITHPSGTKDLQPDHLTQILSGKVTNWKALGGSDQPIIVVGPSKSPMITKFVNERFVPKAHLSSTIKYVLTSEEIIEFVAANPGAIGFGSSRILSPKVQRPQQPDLIRKTYFVTRGAPSENAQKFLDAVIRFQKARERL